MGFYNFNLLAFLNDNDIEVKKLIFMTKSLLSKFNDKLKYVLKKLILLTKKETQNG